MPGQQPELPGVVEVSLRDRIYGEIVAGGRARREGQRIEDCPHPLGTYFWALWRDGYRDDLM